MLIKPPGFGQPRTKVAGQDRISKNAYALCPVTAAVRRTSVRDPPAPANKPAKLPVQDLLLSWEIGSSLRTRAASPV